MAGWITVASADHVATGRAGGFIQVNHGKAAPLRRMQAGEVIACYSPVHVFGTRTPLQAFTAIGLLAAGAPYEGVMAGGFAPWRRAVDWLDARPAAIAPLLDRLQLTAGRRNWGYAFRFGLVAVSSADIGVIADAMGARLPPGAVAVTAG